MSKLPKWARKHLQKCRVAFGFPADYQLEVTPCDEVADGAGADTTSNERYQRVAINVRRDHLVESDLNYEVLTHEMLHAGFSAQHQAIQRIIELLPKRQRAHAWNLWYDGHEASTTQVARALTPIIRRMQE